MPAQKLLSTIVRLKRERNQQFGAGQIIDILRGKRTDRVTQQRHDELATFGIGEDLSDQEWRGVVRQLLARASWPPSTSTARSASPREAPRCSPATVRSPCVASRNAPRVPRRGRPPARRSANAELEPAEAELFETLRAWRAGVAKEQGVPAYIVFGDATLRAIATAARLARRARRHQRHRREEARRLRRGAPRGRRRQRLTPLLGASCDSCGGGPSRSRTIGRDLVHIPQALSPIVMTVLPLWEVFMGERQDTAMVDTAIRTSVSGTTAATVEVAPSNARIDVPALAHQLLGTWADARLAVARARRQARDAAHRGPVDGRAPRPRLRPAQAPRRERAGAPGLPEAPRRRRRPRRQHRRLRGARHSPTRRCRSSRACSGASSAPRSCTSAPSTTTTRSCPAIMSLEVPGAFAMTETGHGSDVAVDRDHGDLRPGDPGVRHRHPVPRGLEGLPRQRGRPRHGGRRLRAAHHRRASTTACTRFYVPIRDDEGVPARASAARTTA